MPNGIGGFATRLNGSTSFPNGDTAATSVAGITGYIGEVVNIACPELSKTDIDVSSFDSPENFMEFIGGSTDPGLIDLTLNYDAAVEEDVLAAYLLTTNQTWTISFPNGTSWRSEGYINKMKGGDTTSNDKISSVLSIKCSGLPTQSTSFVVPTVD
jgi:hypothetical protein